MNILMASAALRRLSLGLSRLGPGLQQPLMGTMEDGFFGEVTADELIAGADLAVRVGLEAAGSYHQAGLRAGWLKFTRAGKVLFVAKQAIRYSISWNQLNNAGVVNGTRREIIKNDGFIVRLMAGGNGDPSSAQGGEWDDLIRKVVNTAGGGSGEWANYPLADLGIGLANSGDSWCMETAGSASYAVSRGRSTVATYNHTLKTTTNTWIGWRPVLELIDPATNVLGLESVSYTVDPKLYESMETTGAVIDRLAAPEEIGYTGDLYTGVQDLNYSIIPQ